MLPLQCRSSTNLVRIPSCSRWPSPQQGRIEVLDCRRRRILGAGIIQVSLDNQTFFTDFFTGEINWVQKAMKTTLKALHGNRVVQWSFEN